jgi:hypothetical protein
VYTLAWRRQLLAAMRDRFFSVIIFDVFLSHPPMSQPFEGSIRGAAGNQPDKVAQRRPCIDSHRECSGTNLKIFFGAT